MPEVSWRAHAACRGHQTDCWFPERGENSSYALSVCRTCSVRDECLAEALETNETIGIWGGKSERELRALRREYVQ